MTTTSTCCLSSSLKTMATGQPCVRCPPDPKNCCNAAPWPHRHCSALSPWGELIRQLEDIGERLEQEGSRQPKQRRKRYSDREASCSSGLIGAPREIARNHSSPQPISQQLGCGLGVAAVRWPRCRLGSRGSRGSRSRPGWGVLGAAVSLQSGRVDLQQDERDLFGPLQLRVRPSDEDQQRQGVLHLVAPGSAALPASELKAA